MLEFLKSNQMTITMSLLFLIIIFELKIPRVLEKGLFKHYSHDAKWFFANEYLMQWLVIYLRSIIAIWLGKAYGHDLLDVTNFHFILQCIFYFLVYDLTIYWLHRVTHRVPFLWNFHKVHHSPEHLTVSTSFRSSWIEMITMGSVNIIYMQLIKIDAGAFFLAYFSHNLYCLILHANLNIKQNKISQALSKVFITPHEHRWHHAKVSVYGHGQNFGGGLRVWDHIFGSFYTSKSLPDKLGVDDDYPKEFYRRFLYPIKINPISKNNTLFKILK